MFWLWCNKSQTPIIDIIVLEFIQNVSIIIQNRQVKGMRDRLMSNQVSKRFYCVLQHLLRNRWKKWYLDYLNYLGVVLYETLEFYVFDCLLKFVINNPENAHCSFTVLKNLWNLFVTNARLISWQNSIIWYWVCEHDNSASLIVLWNDSWGKG